MNSQLSVALTAAHQQIDSDIAELVRATRADDHAALRQKFAVFVEIFQTHKAADELVVFPMLERQWGSMREGPTRALRKDHCFAIELLLHIDEALVSVSSVVAARASLQALRALLRDHFRREYLVYEAYDLLASVSERESLIGRLGVAKGA